MKIISGKDVNEAFAKGMLNMNDPSNTTTKETRTGTVIEYNEPVCTTYKNPKQRVLFNEERDANPFFHLMEGLWMLAGRDDVAFISEFNSNISQYSDNGLWFHGAYGTRIRRYEAECSGPTIQFDQLKEVIEILSKDRHSRRAVVQIWDASLDLSTASNDIPCNDMIFFKIRDEKIDMSVCCRSNDAIWGCYGANAVHFSMIQEYVASMIGCEVGVYNQISDSLHVYPDNPLWDKCRNLYYSGYDFNPYLNYCIDTTPMFDNDMPKYSWDVDLRLFVEEKATNFVHNFFTHTAKPMRNAWRMYKEHGHEAGVEACERIRGMDWRVACKSWLMRRMK